MAENGRKWHKRFPGGFGRFAPLYIRVHSNAVTCRGCQSFDFKARPRTMPFGFKRRARCLNQENAPQEIPTGSKCSAPQRFHWRPRSTGATKGVDHDDATFEWFGLRLTCAVA